MNGRERVRETGKEQKNVQTIWITDDRDIRCEQSEKKTKKHGWGDEDKNIFYMFF